MNSIKAKIFFIIASLLVSASALAEPPGITVSADLPTCKVMNFGNDGRHMCVCAGNKMIGCSDGEWGKGSQNQDQVLARVQQLQGLACNGYEPVDEPQCTLRCNGKCPPSRVRR